jgi:hypothetical protein
LQINIAIPDGGSEILNGHEREGNFKVFGREMKILNPEGNDLRV